MNHKERNNNLLAIVVIVVVILILVQTANNLIQLNKLNKNSIEQEPIIMGTVSEVSDTELSGAVGFGVGVTRMCINTPPIITYDCNLTNATLRMNNTYECQFNATDPNDDAVTFLTDWITNYSFMFNTTLDGKINFTPKRAAMGQENIVRIHAIDDSMCPNNDRYIELNIKVLGENRAPYLIKNIPDQKLVKDHNFIFYLSDYFADPDEDPLIYNRQTMFGYTVGIPETILSNQVVVRGLSCGNTTVYYRASDSLLSAWSNTVNYEVICPQTSAAASGQNEEQQGDGGDGGGGDSQICKPNWKCNDWAQCTFGNFTYRKCIDFAGCDSENYQHYMFENCTYTGEKACSEVWECNPWSTCKDNIHTRICIDMKNCGTNNTKPVESENCNVIPSCFNGIKDQGETAIDCGGQCGVCRNIENPTQIKAPNIVSIITAALIIGISGTLGFIFKAKIKEALMKIFGKKPKIKRKVYISNKQKEKLLQSMNIIQARIDEHKVDNAIDELSIFIKEYFKQLLSIDNLDKHELVTQIVKLKDKDLEKILVMFYAKIANLTHLRNKGADIRESEIQELIDEISHEIYLIAEFNDQDAVNSVKDRTIQIDANNEILNRLYNKMSNLYIALKFGELLIAKSIYKDILKDYEELSHKDKPIVYADIIRAFHAINYLDKLYKI